MNIKIKLFFYYSIILIVIRLGIEYNLYLINNFINKAHLFDTIDFILFSIYFSFYPLFFVFLLNEKPKLTDLELLNKWEKTRKIGRRGWNLEKLLLEKEEEEKEKEEKTSKNIDGFSYKLPVKLPDLNFTENICWNCESTSEKDSLFCMTCGIELNLKKEKNKIIIKESNIKINQNTIDKIRNGLIETGIYIREKKDGKYQAIDYLNLLPEQVQDENRWDNENWNKILNQILTHLGGSLSNSQMVTNKSIVIVILALIQEKNDRGFQPIEHHSLFSEQLQDKNNWSDKIWIITLKQILTHLSKCLSENKIVSSRSIIISILTLLRELNIEAKEMD